MNNLAGMITVIIEIGFVIGFFGLSTRKAKNKNEKQLKIVSCKAVMYVVVSLFTFAGYFGSDYERLFLTSAVVTVSLIESIDNWMYAMELKKLKDDKSEE